jgi:hypothetical protein
MCLGETSPCVGLLSHILQFSKVTFGGQINAQVLKKTASQKALWIVKNLIL